MATLPQSTASLLPGVDFVQQPGRTWRIDKRTNRIQGEVDGLAAVGQAVEILLNVERFRWQIYSPHSGMQWEGLIGQDPGYVACEIQRRMRQALLMDDRVRGISDFSYSVVGNVLTASVRVDTVFGAVAKNLEVRLS